MLLSLGIDKDVILFNNCTEGGTISQIALTQVGIYIGVFSLLNKLPFQ